MTTNMGIAAEKKLGMDVLISSHIIFALGTRVSVEVAQIQCT